MKEFSGRLPILGVCMGHQIVGVVFGASVRRARTIKHGKTSEVRHRGGFCTEGCPRFLKLCATTVL